MSTATAPTGLATEHSAYSELIGLVKQAAVLGSVGSVLGWDQETMMPPKAAAYRAEQLSTISTLAHQRGTDPRIGELLGECEGDSALQSDERIAANLRELRREYDRATKLPDELVSEMSQTNSKAMHAWREARGKSDFKAFQPWLEKQVELNRRKAECYGAPDGGELYDALIEDFEPGVSAAEIESIFTPLREQLSALIADVGSKPGATAGRGDAFGAPTAAQLELVRFVTERVGFDYEAGRIDLSTHPFSETTGPLDNRITTRFDENDFTDAVATALHEAGHGMYEQGLSPEHFGEPLGSYISLGIHESQSRMWENQVGRSKPFWAWLLPEAQKRLGGAPKGMDLDAVYKAVNTCKPHFIRVESDESTYNLHIMLRFDIERALIRGDLKVADVPGVWNERMKKDLGLDVPDDRRGCLQDIHWSMGAIGYFPTYTLGNLHSAQMWDAINEQIPDLPTKIEKGEFAPLLDWLRTNVHAHGRRYRAGGLIERISGRGLTSGPLVTYLKDKLRGIYG